MIPFQGDKLTLQECLEEGRVTTVQKTRTITSKSNSVQKGIIQNKRQQNPKQQQNSNSEFLNILLFYSFQYSHV